MQNKDYKDFNPMLVTGTVSKNAIYLVVVGPTYRAVTMGAIFNISEQY